MSDPMRREPLGDGVLTLRPWRKEDAAVLVDCIDGDEAIARWLDQIPQPYTLAEAHAYLDGLGADAYAIADAATGRVLGSVGLSPIQDGVGEVGYWLRADARGRGLATRAVLLLVRWALAQPQVERVQLRAAVDNLASRRVAERAGFTLEGVLRSAHWSPRLRRRLDWALYSILPGELA